MALRGLRAKEQINIKLLQYVLFYTVLKTCLLSARDVVSELKESGVSNAEDFEWISQLRYYYEDEEVMVRMITTTVPYGYEYLGNTGRLVITPLTDRCYRSGNTRFYRYIYFII